MDGALTFADEQNWFVVAEPSNGVFAIHEPFHDLDVRSHLVTGAKRAILVDIVTGVDSIRKIVESITESPVTVVNRHAHWDHIRGNWQFNDIPYLHLMLPCHSAGEMPVGMIPQMMRDVMAEVLNGRPPEENGDEQANHQFDGFAICVRPDYRGRQAQ